ncbi:hypothetical protein [Elioraea sp.]|uniref:hypothetical protein n=1 Tax=Elioraea sp. TaxID=2185103 RepID=UPI00307FCA0B
MPSPNLSITHVAAAQNQKEVTINDAVDALDNAMNRALSLAMADSNVTLTADQANRNGLVVLTGALTAPRTVTLPANHRRLALRNATIGGFAVTAKYPCGGATVAVLPETTALLQGDGTDLYGVAGGGGVEALDDLVDVSVAGAANGDLLRFDGALWMPAGAGILQRVMLPFRGALLRRTANYTVSTTGAYVAIPWQSAVYDTDAFWNAGQATRLTVPTGVTKVRLAGNIEWQTSPTSQLVEVRKNGVSVVGGGSFIVRGDSGYTNQMRNVVSAVIPVVAGDWFDLAVYIGTAGELRSLERTWFAIEVVETEDAADPPADHSAFKPGQPGASEALLRVPVARRTRFAAGLAGSHGSAGTAAANQTDFDVQRNGTSFATMRFAASASTAVFIAASEIVLEPGDVLSVVAPASPDATLADVGFTLAGALAP